MAKKIIYIHPGDMIEVRFCDPELPANAAEWRNRTRPRHSTIRFDGHGDLEVFDAVSTNVFAGTGSVRRQMLEARRERE